MEFNSNIDRVVEPNAEATITIQFPIISEEVGTFIERRQQAKIHKLNDWEVVTNCTLISVSIDGEPENIKNPNILRKVFTDRKNVNSKVEITVRMKRLNHKLFLYI